MAKFCAHCGHPMGDADLFCANCGRPAAPPQPPAAPQPPAGQWQAPAPQPVRQGQWQPQHQAPRSPRSGRELLIGVIAVVVAAVLLIGGFVWPGFFKKSGGGAPEVGDVTPAPTEAPAVTEPPQETAAPKPTQSPADAPAPTEAPAATPAPTAAAYQNPFTDVASSDWFCDAVMWAGEHGIVSGTEFKPGDLTNRGQALTFLWRCAGKPAPGLTECPYSDVAEADYFYAPVLWGYENGVISSSGDGMFHAEGALTRAQAITFLYRAAGGSDDAGKRSFSDVREDNWYFASANWALENGVVGRDTSWAFHPDQQMTRAMFVTFLYRAFAEDARKADNSDPAPEGLKDVGIRINVDAQTPQTFRSVTKNGNPLTFTAAVTDYRVFEADDAMPKREGFEWRVMTVETATTDLDGSGLRLSLQLTDAYNVRLHDASRKTDDSGMYTYTVLYNGRLVDTTIWWVKLSDDNKGTSTWKFTASVPIGYDGVVVGFKNAEITAGSRSLADYYTGADDFALFRMQ